MDQPDLFQLHQVARQLPLVLPERGGLHPEMGLDCTAGVGLLRHRRVSQLRAGADLLARPQPEGDEGPKAGTSSASTGSASRSTSTSPNGRPVAGLATTDTVNIVEALGDSFDYASITRPTLDARRTRPRRLPRGRARLCRHETRRPKPGASARMELRNP